MSTEALAEIFTVLRKYTNISAKVLIETTKQGNLWTTISLKQSTGIQSRPLFSKNSSSRKPKKKVLLAFCEIKIVKKPTSQERLDPLIRTPPGTLPLPDLWTLASPDPRTLGTRTLPSHVPCPWIYLLSPAPHLPPRQTYLPLRQVPPPLSVG